MTNFWNIWTKVNYSSLKLCSNLIYAKSTSSTTDTLGSLPSTISIATTTTKPSDQLLYQDPTFPLSQDPIFNLAQRWKASNQKEASMQWMPLLFDTWNSRYSKSSFGRILPFVGKLLLSLSRRNWLLSEICFHLKYFQGFCTHSSLPCQEPLVKLSFNIMSGGKD